MGQVKDHEDLRRRNGRKHSQGQAFYRHLAALGSFGLLIGLALFTAKVQGAPSQASSTLRNPWKFDKAAAWQHLTKQCSYGPRNTGSKGYLACKDYLVGEVKKYCDNVHTDDFTHLWSSTHKNVAMSNIVGEQNWKDAKVHVLLIAHWDTRPTSDQESDPQLARLPIMGANDGASGVAVLLELMRAVKGRLPKDVGVMYLLSDGEDLGPELDEMFLGAAFFARKLPSPKPDYGILLDMIGDKDLQVPMEPNSMRYAGPLVKAFYRNAAQVGLQETFPQSDGPTIEDDHIPINEAGIPTMDLIDFDYRPWHTQSDTVDKCSSESLGKIGIALESWLLKSPSFTMPK